MNINSTKKTLSIAIPTYNGSRYIAEAIDSIFKQYSPELFSAVEVVVINNASTDNTKDTIKCYVESGQIRIHTHKENIGFDSNIISAFNICQGDYVLFLGDDDYLQENSIAAILNVLNSGNYQALLLPISFHNTRTQSVNFKEKFEKDKIFSNISNFFQETEFDSSCISSLCFRRVDIAKLQIKKHINSNWIHIALLIEIVGSANQAFCFHQNMVTVRIHNNRWEDNFGNQLLSGLTHLNLIKSYCKANFINENVYRKLSRIKYRQNFRAIVGLKPKQLRDQLKCAALMIQLFPKNVSLWLIQLPLLLLPNPIFKLFLNLYRYFRVTFRYLKIAYQKKQHEKNNI